MKLSETHEIGRYIDDKNFPGPRQYQFVHVVKSLWQMEDPAYHIRFDDGELTTPRSASDLAELLRWLADEIEKL